MGNFSKQVLEFLAEVLLDIQVVYLADLLEASVEAQAGSEEDLVDLAEVLAEVLAGLVEALVAQVAVLEVTIQVVDLATALGDMVVAVLHPHLRHLAVGPRLAEPTARPIRVCRIS